MSQLRAFAKEVEEQQLEAKEHTGAIMAARQADELIEAIPFVAHLSNQIMKRVTDFGSPKLADEQKAEMALDGLALGDQLSKEAMPKLVKESILVALGTDSADARNRMLMAAKKIAAVRPPSFYTSSAPSLTPHRTSSSWPSMHRVALHRRVPRPQRRRRRSRRSSAAA